MDWPFIAIMAVFAYPFLGFVGVKLWRWIETRNWQGSILLYQAFFAWLLWPLVVLWALYEVVTEAEV